MRKSILGDWGSNLGDADYACALAALGVLEFTGTEVHRPSSDPSALASALETEFANGERTPIWRGATNVQGETRASWGETVHADAAALAAAWRQYRESQKQHPRRSPRLAVALDWRSRADLFDFEALCGWLKLPDVGLDALVLAESHAGSGRVAWHWPVRVGVPAGAEQADILTALHVAQGRKTWSKRLSECYTVGAGRDACDLLILTRAAAQRLLDESPNRIHASFVVCLEEPPPPGSQLDDGYLALRDRLCAAAVAVIGRLDPSAIPEWFNAVLRELSHDLPIHAAVYGVGHWRLNRDPLVVGRPEALDQCRIVAIAARQDRVVSAIERGSPSSLPGDAVSGLGRKPTFRRPGSGRDTGVKPSPAGGPQPGLAEALRGRPFVSEDVDGVDTAETLAQHAADIEQARAPRWIQATAWHSDAPQVAARSIAPGHWNPLSIHIGPSAEQRGDDPFPDGRVDFSRGDVAVTVQLELAGAAVAPLQAALREIVPVHKRRDVAQELLRGPLARLAAPPAADDDATAVGLASFEIFLPPVGDSTLAWFAVCPEARVSRLDGRIAIIHNNRVLQTARLSVDVSVRADPGLPAVASEATIHPRDDDLDERRDYDVAIQVSDVGGKLHLTVQRKGTVTLVQLDELDQPVAGVRKALEGAAMRWDYSKPMLKQAVFKQTLYSLAAHGSALEQHLRKKCGNDVGHWKRIHLVPATNEFLPLEYVYDGPPPKVGAEVCGNILDALDRGSCDLALDGSTGTSPCPNRSDKSFVCPMHFWGFRRLIERNGTVHPASPPSPGQGLSPTVCVPSKRGYGKVGSMLLAASQRAFAYAKSPQARAAERAALVQALGVLSSAVSEASDWDQWREQIKKNPNLLVLVAHTDQYLGTPVLEIGDKKLLGRHEILPDVSGAAGKPQLLILLGCSAADVTESFQPYPERFRDAGVSIVLAPLAPIRGADAIPIAKRIAQRLADLLAKPAPAAFGEFLPLLRRELLREGCPGVMGIVGFGDGDWLLGGP